jgi:hypothetical protein
MERAYLALAAFFGGILLSLGLWTASHEPFDGRKFLGSVIRSFLAGLIFAVKLPAAPLDWQCVLSAILTGMGGDTALNVIATLATGNGSFPIPKGSTTDKVTTPSDPATPPTPPPITPTGTT